MKPNENILYNLNLPINLILDKTNLYLESCIELLNRYDSDIRKFIINEVRFSFYSSFSILKKIDGITMIKKYYDKYMIEAFVFTDSKIETYYVPEGSMDEGWRTVKGNFKSDIYFGAPLYLFEVQNDIIIEKLKLELDDVIKKRIRMNKESMNNQIDMINKKIGNLELLEGRIK